MPSSSPSRRAMSGRGGRSREQRDNYPPREGLAPPPPPSLSLLSFLYWPNRDWSTSGRMSNSLPSACSLALSDRQESRQIEESRVEESTRESMRGGGCTMRNYCTQASSEWMDVDEQQRLGLQRRIKNEWNERIQWSPGFRFAKLFQRMANWAGGDSRCTGESRVRGIQPFQYRSILFL